MNTKLKRGRSYILIMPTADIEGQQKFVALLEKQMEIKIPIYLGNTVQSCFQFIEIEE